MGASAVSLSGLSRSWRKITPQLCIQFIDPTGFGVRKSIRVGHVGFDIENRCAIQEVNTSKVQRPAFDLYQFYSRQADRIGTMRRAGGQNAPFWTTPRRLDTAFPSFAQMKGEDQPQPVEAAQILNDFLVQPILEFQGGNREIPAFRAFHHRALMGGINPAGLGGSQDANGAIDDMGVLGHVRWFLFRRTLAGNAQLNQASCRYLSLHPELSKLSISELNSKRNILLTCPSTFPL